MKSPFETQTQFITPHARAEIIRRLRQAMVFAVDDLDANFDRFRDVLGDLSDRADALDLTRTTLASADAGRAAPVHDSQCEVAEAIPLASDWGAGLSQQRLACTALSTPRGEPVREFRLIAFGDVRVDRPLAGSDFAFTREHANAAIAWFDSTGRKLAVDYEHQTFDRFNSRPDGLRPAAGWIGGLEVRSDGLWAVDVTWTPRAAELLRTGEYRYFSPVLFWKDESRAELAALGPVALTNDPAMRGVAALAAARSTDEPIDEGAAAPVGIKDFATQPAASEFPESRNGSAADDATTRLSAAQARIEFLTRQLRSQEADTFVERGMRQGRILESTSMDWRDDYLRDSQAAESRLARSPILLPPGRVMQLGARGELTPLRSTPPQIGAAIAAEADDLSAFDRAQAAGRVIYPGSGAAS